MQQALSILESRNLMIAEGWSLTFLFSDKSFVSKNLIEHRNKSLFTFFKSGKLNLDLLEPLNSHSF